MTKFAYTVKDKGGKTIKGVLKAPSKDNAIKNLRDKELVILALREERGGGGIFKSLSGLKKQGIKIEDLILFSRQLATMVNAGIPLVNALDILSEQTENVKFKQIIAEVRDNVETGSSLSEGMSKHTQIFSSLFVNMVRAGESSGMLDEILDRLATYLEKTGGLQKKIKSALVYPIAVTIMAFAITAFLLLKVIPVFTEIYAGFDTALPAPTQFLITVSNFMRKYFYAVIILFTIIGFAISRYIRTEKGKFRLDSLKLNIPIFGILVKKVAVGKFTRTLSTLIKSGVPILGSLEIVSKTSGNKVVEEAVDKVRMNVKEGESISEPLSRSGVFPPMVVRMISVGEQTGELEKMLGKIADFYDQEVDAAVSGLTSLIEPLIIAFLGIVIGGIVVCMFLPIFEITSVLS